MVKSTREKHLTDDKSVMVRLIQRRSFLRLLWGGVLGATGVAAGISTFERAEAKLNGTINLSDYDFIAPEGWRVQNNKDHLLIQNMQSGCLILIFEPQPSPSGDLDQNAIAVFETMYAGWQYRETGEQQYVLSKGFLPKGLEYSMMEAGMRKLSADGSRYDGFEGGAALVIKTGNQIVIIAVRHNSTMSAHLDCIKKYNTWRRFFNSFTVKNAAVARNTEEDVSIRIVGRWTMSESMGSGEYVFAANGNYAFYGALGQTTPDGIKTQAFQGDGSYSIAGNQLTMKKRGDNPEQVRFRFEKVNHGGTGWKDRLCILGKDRFGEKEACYERRVR